jgi:hypothetical protein
MVTISDLRRFDLVTMPDPSILGLVAVPATDDASLAETDDVTHVLPRFRSLRWLENRGLYSFDPKTSFAAHF